MSQSLSSEFWASNGLPFIIFALLEFAEKVDAIDGGLETLADGGNSKSIQIGGRNASLAVPRVDFVQNRSDPGRENTHRSRIDPTFIQDLDGREEFNVDFSFFVSIGGHCVSLGLCNGGDILCSLEHTKGGSECEVTDNIEGEVIVP